jgi:hypothetical protein
MSGLDEKACEVCGRHVMADPQPATGWLARCGRRLTRIDECGTAEACIDPSATTPADVGEEPVAWQKRHLVASFEGEKWSGWSDCLAGEADFITRTKHNDNGFFSEVRPLYSATALERVVRERDEARARLQTAYQVKAEMNDLANAERHARLAAEVKLAEARKMIERYWKGAYWAAMADHDADAVNAFLEETK